MFGDMLVGLNNPDMNAQIAAALGQCSSPGRFGQQFWRIKAWSS